jgi:cold shock CspA family protein
MTRREFRNIQPGGAAVADTGRIVRLFVGQGYGFIRRMTDDEVYFHRSDVNEGTSINDLAIGDLVAFERLDDRISGARALRVRRLLRLVSIGDE